MMRNLLVFIMLTFTTFSLCAQIVYKPAHLSIVNTPNGGGKLLEFHITNTQHETVQAYWKLVKDNTFLSNWETYICDLEYCYGINIDQSNPSLPNNLKMGDNLFQFHFDAKNVHGYANVILKLYSDKNLTKEILSIPVNLNATYLNQVPTELAINTTPSSGDNKLNIVYANSHDTTYTMYWKVIKDNNTWKPQWETYVCDLEFCYGNNIDQSSPSIPTNKLIKGNNLIEFHFFPNNVPGNTIIGFKLFADKNFTQEIYSSTIYINSGLSATDESHHISSFYVSPNPALDQITLPDHLQASTIDIINMRGEKLKSLHVRYQSSVNVADLSSGMYFIKAYSDSSKAVGFTKFVKL